MRAGSLTRASAATNAASAVADGAARKPATSCCKSLRMVASSDFRLAV